jgi:hypothetical protein
LALLLSYLLYDSEFKYSNDKEALSAAITEFASQSRNPIDAYVLETKEINDVLVATFKDKESSNVNGLAILAKGLNQRYRIIRANIESSNYSSVIQTYKIEIKDQPYYVVSGYNLSDKIKYYGLDYNAYTSPGYLAKDRVRKVIEFEVKNQQFLEIYHCQELDSLFKKLVKNTLYNPILISSSLYDANGMEVTDNFRLLENNTQVSYGIGKAELFLLYVYITLILGLGIIFTRYFLTE